MRSRSPTARPLERRAKNSAAVSGRSIVIMEIRHKRLNAGEAHALASFQFFDRIARSSAAHQLGLQLRLMGLITRAALGTPIFHKIGKGAMAGHRSEEHTSELQSLMRNSYAVFCLKKKNQQPKTRKPTN